MIATNIRSHDLFFFHKKIEFLKILQCSKLTKHKKTLGYKNCTARADRRRGGKPSFYCQQGQDAGTWWTRVQRQYAECECNVPQDYMQQAQMNGPHT